MVEPSNGIRENVEEGWPCASFSYSLIRSTWSGVDIPFGEENNLYFIHLRFLDRNLFHLYFILIDFKKMDIMNHCLFNMKV